MWEVFTLASRQELQALLEKLLGSKQVYYQAPESVKMSYPAIRYSKSRIDTKKADNKNYIKNTKYDIIVIDKMPDNRVIEKLMEIPYCSFDRHYVSDGLNHDSLTLYF